MDNKAINEQPSYLLGRRIGYIDGSTYFPQGSILDVLTYVLKNQPSSETLGKKQKNKTGNLKAMEVIRSGNFEYKLNDEWLDYKRLGYQSQSEMINYLHDILIKIKMDNDIRSLGLRGSLDPETNSELANAILIAREKFRSRLDELGFSDFVEPFDPENYNNQASIGENLLFGTAIDESFKLEKLPNNSIVMETLKEAELENDLFELGKNVAETTLELFGDLNIDDPFFDQLTYMTADELPEYKETLNRIGNKKDLEQIQSKDRLMIMRLPLAYIEEQNRLGLLTDTLKEKILTARKKLRSKLMELPTSPVSFYERDSYNSSASIQDNVLLGRVSSTVPEGLERVTIAIRDLLEEMHLTDDIFNIGLSFNIGSGGKRLSEVQRQKLHLARILLKKPDIVIINQGLNTLGTREQNEIINSLFLIYP